MFLVGGAELCFVSVKGSFVNRQRLTTDSILNVMMANTFSCVLFDRVLIFGRFVVRGNSAFSRSSFFSEGEVIIFILGTL